MRLSDGKALSLRSFRSEHRITLGASAAICLMLSLPTPSAAALTGTPYLSDLTPASAINGWGAYEKDLSNGEQATGDGKTITINGVTYKKGMGVHAPSDITYTLGSACSAFTASAGIDAEAGTAASVIFQVYTDGTKVYDSGAVRKGTATQSVSINVTSKNLLRLVVTDGGDGNASDHADWANAQLNCATSSAASYLSDLSWTTTANGWGPAEKDLSNGEKAAGDGKTITLNGVKYTKGIGTHAASDIRYTMGGTCTAFTSDIGIDDESRPNGSVVFQVWTDGTKLYDSGTLTGASATQSVSVNVTGKTQLQLVVTDGGNGNANDHADWANARLTCQSAAPVTPANTAPVVSAGSTQSIVLPATATLSGSASDDGLPNKTLTTTWSMVSGPATVTFSTPASVSTVATFTAAGSYTLRLTATDGSLSTTSDVAVTVAAAPVVAPVSTSPIPADSGVVNVKTAYGAKGDGSTDDTAAILRAIQTSIAVRDRIIYFPAGTYVVSAPLEWKDANGGWGAYLSFQGESRTTAIIKLKDNAAGYSDATNPKAVIFTASNVGTNPDWPNGTGNEGFRNNIFSLTVNTGSGNPGATGIDYMAHNQARIDDVTIMSGDGAGAVGLSMNRKWIGPLLVTNVKVTGFNLGIWVDDSMSSATLEHITLQGQKVAGIRNSDNIVSIRDLTSVNSVPAVQNTSWAGLVTLLDANLTGGSSAVSAIQNTGGTLYARNIVSSGYASAINNGGTVVSGANQTEFVSKTSSSLFPSTQASLKLPVQDTPSFVDTNLANWTNVTSYGAASNDLKDDTAAIQAAIDSGKTTVYLPQGDYRLSDTIHIRGNVRRIIGYGARFSPVNTTSFTAAKPAFRMESTAVPFVVLERLAFTANYDVTGFPAFASIFEHTSSGVLVLKDMMDITYKGYAGAGNIFLEDVCCGPFEFNGQNAWARQLDPETGLTHVRNIGGKVWILGLKTEQVSTVIETTNGGQTELLGAFISIWNNVTTVPAFINTESSHSLIFATCADYNFSTAVQETRSGVTLNMPGTSLPTRYLGMNVPLYAGYK
jgi:hypothetical protein